jgi:2-iminobutanoate/2-iminopropanoate deaminase|tara:strand:- start:45 stop:413 length:369 start_codon:yes stop_codon:yes gene_type:complete
VDREVIGPLKRVPLSQAVKAGGFVFVSGNIPLRPGTTEMVQGGIEAETRQTLDNIASVLKNAGSAMERVVKTTVYLADMADFAAMNGVYAGYFPVEPPARTTVQVAALALGARIEIEAVALV